MRGKRNHLEISKDAFDCWVKLVGETYCEHKPELLRTNYYLKPERKLIGYSIRYGPLGSEAYFAITDGSGPVSSPESVVLEPGCSLDPTYERIPPYKRRPSLPDEAPDNAGI